MLVKITGSLRRQRHGVWRILSFKETHFKDTAPTSPSCEDAGVEVPLITIMASKLKSVMALGKPASLEPCREGEVLQAFPPLGPCDQLTLGLLWSQQSSPWLSAHSWFPLSLWLL